MSLNGYVLVLCICIGKCVACEEEYYQVTNGSCMPCQRPCKTCNNSSIYCTQCHSRHFLHESTCISCPVHCSECTPRQGYDMPTAICTKCFSGEYIVNDYCRPCHSNCKECSTVKDNCTQCDWMSILETKDSEDSTTLTCSYTVFMVIIAVVIVILFGIVMCWLWITRNGHICPCTVVDGKMIFVNPIHSLDDTDVWEDYYNNRGEFGGNDTADAPNVSTETEQPTGSQTGERTCNPDVTVPLLASDISGDYRVTIHTATPTRALRAIRPDSIASIKSPAHATFELFEDIVLGKGAASHVFKGSYHNRPVAIKRILYTDRAYEEELQREMQILNHLEKDRHENIIGFYLAEYHTPFLYLVLELLDGTLEDYLKPENSYWREDRSPTQVSKCMAEGLRYLHFNNIVHRDLKPQNILFSLNGKCITKVCLADFGMSKATEHGAFSVSGQFGTEGYRAPETWDFNNDCVKHENCDNRADVFSLGILMCYTFTAEHPFGSKRSRQNNIVKNKKSLDELFRLDHTFGNLTQAMLDPNPVQRPGIVSVCTHPALWDNDYVKEFFNKVSDVLESKRTHIPWPQLDDPSLIPDSNWVQRLPQNLQNYIATYSAGRRKPPYYKGHEDSVYYLLRAIRNTNHHHDTYPVSAQAELGHFPSGHMKVWKSACPGLLIHVYNSLPGIGMQWDNQQKVVNKQTHGQSALTGASAPVFSGPIQSTTTSSLSPGITTLTTASTMLGGYPTHAQSAMPGVSPPVPSGPIQSTTTTSMSPGIATQTAASTTVSSQSSVPSSITTKSPLGSTSVTTASITSSSQSSIPSTTSTSSTPGTSATVSALTISSSQSSILSTTTTSSTPGTSAIMFALTISSSQSAVPSSTSTISSSQSAVPSSTSTISSSQSVVPSSTSTISSSQSVVPSSTSTTSSSPSVLPSTTSTISSSQSAVPPSTSTTSSSQSAVSSSTSIISSASTTLPSGLSIQSNTTTSSSSGTTTLTTSSSSTTSSSQSPIMSTSTTRSSTGTTMTTTV